MTRDVRINEAALRRLIEGDAGRRYFKKAADTIRDRARTNALAVDPTAVGAIESVVEVDSEGLHADIGYNKNHGGFTLWWAEVGTINQPAQPHLRPALKPGDDPS